MPTSPKLFTEFPRNLLSKRTESIWCLFGNKFVVDKLSENCHVLDYCVIRLPVTVSSRQNADSQKFRSIPENSSTTIQNNLNNCFTFPTKHRILPIRFNWTFCGHSVNNFDCRALLIGSRIKAKPCKFVACTSSEKSSTIVRNNF